MNQNFMSLSAKYMAAEEHREELIDDVREIKSEIQVLVAMSNRWRGGFIALAALGGIVGWALTSWDTVLHLLGLVGSRR